MGLMLAGLAALAWSALNLQERVVLQPTPGPTSTVTLSPAPRATVTITPGRDTVIVRPDRPDETVVIVSPPDPQPGPTATATATATVTCDPTPIFGSCRRGRP